MERTQLALVAAMCGAIAFIGVLLPWCSVSASLGGMTAGSGTANGTEGDFNGVFVLILTVIASLVALLAWAGKSFGICIKLLATLAGAGAAFLARRKPGPAAEASVTVDEAH